MVNSGGFGARSDGATPISNRRALSDDVTNFSSIDYNKILLLSSSINHNVSNFLVSCNLKIFILI
ncbi:MAG: palindromic element RPE2 domain-containing protein [Rickettsia endosymbiont of Labidopullus appendiculatus]|nr:palindromic element RPE2 domain-containing protein [Rickettsia endosymbiont of Labidopullus appendiculatus]